MKLHLLATMMTLTVVTFAACSESSDMRTSASLAPSNTSADDSPLIEPAPAGKVSVATKKPTATPNVEIEPTASTSSKDNNILMAEAIEVATAAPTPLTAATLEPTATPTVAAATPTATAAPLPSVQFASGLPNESSSDLSVQVNGINGATAYSYSVAQGSACGANPGNYQIVSASIRTNISTNGSYILCAWGKNDANAVQALPTQYTWTRNVAAPVAPAAPAPTWKWKFKECRGNAFLTNWCQIAGGHGTPCTPGQPGECRSNDCGGNGIWGCDLW